MHGDPIPEGNGHLEASAARPMHHYTPGSKLVVRRVEDAGADFFRRLQALEITLGKSYELLSISAFDGSLEVVTSGADGVQPGPPFFLSRTMSSNIYVEEL